jgi:hypothetical protein
MKMLIGFLIVCNSYAMQNNPLIHGVPSYYAPQMDKAIKKENRDEVIRLYKLDSKLICVLQKRAQEAQENNPWILSVFNDIKKIHEERSNKYKNQQEDNISLITLRNNKVAAQIDIRARL